ncbi:MAG: hypothetical protein ACRDPL_12875 [Propionibacteriaceae bacterium]
MTKRIGLLGRLREHYGLNVLFAKANTRRMCTATLYGELAKAMFLCRQSG